MSLVVGFNLGKYVLLGADTRVTSYPPGEPARHSDDRQKISKTSLGLISGTGLTDLLDSVKKRLLEEEIQHTHQIIAMAEEERTWFREEGPFPIDQRLRQGLDQTCWLFSYWTLSETREPLLRLGLCQGHEKYEFHLARENAAVVLMPSETLPEEAEAITSMLQEQVRPFTEIADLQASIRHHVGVAAALIRGVSSRFDTVSPTFQVGVQTIDALSGISPVIDGQDDWSFTLSRT